MYELPGALAPMALYRQFIVCRLVAHPTKPGKFNKYPVNPTSGEVWNAHDPAIWLDVGTATSLASWYGPGHGVGFVFTDADPFWFVDIDNCATPDGRWSDLARHVVAAFPGAAVEVSQSGRGLHLFGVGTVPEHSCRNDRLGLEFYHRDRFVYLGTGAVGSAGTDCSIGLQWLTEHFFPPRQEAISGPEWRDAPVPEWSGPTDDDELIARALASRQSAAAAFGGRASFLDLWEGNAEALGKSFPDSGGRAYDASAADAALASHLAYFTGNHHERIERLMRRSALVRDKWERADYIRGTISYCCSRTSKWLSDAPVPSPADVAGLSFAAAAGGAIPATIINVQNALKSSESGVQLRLDQFRDRIVVQHKETGEWTDFTDVHYVRLRSTLELCGFKPVGSELMRDAVLAVATENAFDSGIEWGNGLRWDGLPRVATAMVRYFGCEDTPYTRAVSLYLFTALAGRLMSPGCQADMAVILVDQRQGTGKTSSVKALAPFPQAFGEIDLSKIDDDNTARKLRGKLVIELGELRGLASKDDEAIKAWVSRTEEEWTPKYREFNTTFQRRCILIGTSNRDDLLSDPTGNRRWLPVRSGDLDPAALAADCEQLWAEAISLWRAGGIQWRDAQELAKGEHEQFQRDDSDPWDEPVRAWLNGMPVPAPGEVPLPVTRGDGHVCLHDVMIGALRLDIAKCSKREEHRLGGVMRRLGYFKTTVTLPDGVRVKRWRRNGLPG
jgi:hypothetical protein